MACGADTVKKIDTRLDELLDALSATQRRATYGAVAGFVGQPATFLMNGRPRDARHSWIVNQNTGLPTGYDADAVDPKLSEHVEIIRTVEELQEFLDGHREARHEVLDSKERKLDLLSEAKRIAREYRHLTGRPLGVTGEIAEYEAVSILGLELADVRQPGYDAIRREGQRQTRLQIKGRCLLPNRKPGQRLGTIRLDKEWDAVLLVLMNADYDACEMYEADRAAVTAALNAPGSRSRNERGALGVSKFKSIAGGTPIWRSETRRLR